MKEVIQKSIIILSMGLFLIGNVYAAGQLDDIEVESTTNTTIDLSWGEVSDSFGYYVSYGKSSGVDNGYESEYDDLLDVPKVKLSGLDEATTYYISVLSVDQNGDEIVTSSEVVSSTASSGTKSEKLTLDTAEVVSPNNLELTFDTEIDGSNTLDFILKSISTGQEIGINDIKVSGANVMLRVDSTFETEKQYEILIVNIVGLNGAIIKDGLDGSVKITAPDMTIFDEVEEEVVLESPLEVLDPEVAPSIIAQSELSQEPITDTLEQEEQDVTPSEINMQDKDVLNESSELEQTQVENIELNAAGEENNELNNDEGKSNIAGKEVPVEDLANFTTVVAEENENLPSTGPEHILLIFFSFVIAFGVFKLNKRKDS